MMFTDVGNDPAHIQFRKLYRRGGDERARRKSTNPAIGSSTEHEKRQFQQIDFLDEAEEQKTRERTGWRLGLQSLSKSVSDP